MYCYALGILIKDTGEEFPGWLACLLAALSVFFASCLDQLYGKESTQQSS